MAGWLWTGKSCWKVTPTVSMRAYVSYPSNNQPRLATINVFHCRRLSTRYQGTAVASVSSDNRVFGKDHFLEVLVGHGAGHFGAELRQVGAGVAVEVALKIGERDHALADAGDDVGRNRRFSMAGDGRENCGEEGEAAHGAREV